MIAGGRTLGESCGSCNCPPTYTLGECDDGFDCKHLTPDVPDAAGTCVKRGMLGHWDCIGTDGVKYKVPTVI